MLLALVASQAKSQTVATFDPAANSDLSAQRTAAGATLNYFGALDPGVYKGSKPSSDADYRFLQSLHVKYIVVLRVLPFTHRAENREAKKFGITLIQEEMNASPFQPSQRHMEEILAVLRDARYHPVYFHCAFGRDRTSVVATLYEMYFKGLPQEQAMRYLHESGYKDGWVRSGLTRYVRKHPIPPVALLSTAP
jgi:protein tyrosine/serine phosphatase